MSEFENNEIEPNANQNTEQKQYESQSLEQKQYVKAKQNAKNKKGKRTKKNKKGFKFLLVLLVIIAIAITAIHFIFNHVYEKVPEKTNLIINNSNVTQFLKSDIYIENGVVYVSSKDIGNFIDSNIYYDNKYDQIITSSYDKLAVLPVNKKQIKVNGGTTNIKAAVVQKNETYYLPFSELENVYNIKVNYIDKTNIVTVDSLDRDYNIATAKKDTNVRYSPTIFSKTVAKVKKGDGYTIANREDYPVPDGWTRVRTDYGILGYVKTNDMGPVNTIRDAMVPKKKIEGPVSMTWDYYSEYVTAPVRTGTTIKGVNVVSPSFFYLVKLGKGEVLSNIGENGQAYIKWAKENNYQIWPMISNNSYIDTTSEIMRDYKLREKLINQIVDYITRYELNGINIDFEYMYDEDKDLFTQFLVELRPYLNEIGAVLSVDVTAPDGGENWSLCYDRNAIGKVADYIVFMAYDQYGNSATKSGTTAGLNWVETNINKFINQEEVAPEKIVLGIPFYTRLWLERNGKVVSKDTVSMNNIKNVIPSGAEKKWNEDLKQNYVEYKVSGSTYKMWIEDEKSLEERLNLINNYKLGGAAYWEKDMELSSVWSLISDKLGI